ncbi:hypothetical protein H257_12811 [Aphanomyces astaci]|uniref:Uncharacterized protein n=1 Tax=Aphanomyces astaci TaxID=112090 RepID=W4FYY9_APHAT|nr:hypothetical protein H257_12811 [Aphanomyces astaci]ETV72004.1 hypothetical protein H257_12811 [Aphanomyces astaci]|eukprot:XP_009838447.1 hypothetical protein H257_12811 [Aphanomyces astaci]
MRAVAAGLGIPTTTLHAYYKRGAIVKYSSYVKPALTDANKVARPEVGSRPRRRRLVAALQEPDVI